MEQETRWEKELTHKHFDILDYIKENGEFAVEVAASFVKQNKNFYGRIKKLENLKLISVSRENGFASFMNLTTKGKEVHSYLKLKNFVSNYVSNNLHNFTEEELLLSIIKNSSISDSHKKRLIDVLL